VQLLSHIHTLSMATEYYNQLTTSQHPQGCVTLYILGGAVCIGLDDSALNSDWLRNINQQCTTETVTDYERNAYNFVGANAIIKSNI